MSAAGQPFGRYTLHERLGAGGMAEVWRASLSHQGVEKRLVIKRILRGLSADPAFLAMFIDEARIASLLHHPNIVQLYDLGEVDGEWYLAMEHVQGLNLNRALHSLTSRRRRMDAELVAYLGHEVARGLDAAHRLTDHDGRALKVVHRDICPANLLLSTQGDVKIVDFGVARSAANTFTTQGAGLKGHVAYMSPEQALGATLDGRSDLFALGVVMWEALAGQRLFKADSGLLTLERVRDAEVPPLPEGRVPPALEAIVRQALAREPDDRFPDARAMQLALAPLVGPLEPQRERLAAVVNEVLAAERAEESARLVALTPPGPSADDEAPTTVSADPAPPRAPTPAAPPPVTSPEPTPAKVAPAPPRSGRRRWLLLAALIPLALTLWPRGAETPPAPSPTTDAPAADLAAPAEAPPAPTTATAPATAPTTDEAPPAPTPTRGPPPPAAPSPSPTAIAPETTAPPPEPATAAPTTPSAPLPAEPPPAAAPTPEAAPEAPAELDPNTPARLTVTITQGLAELRIDGVKVKKKPPYADLPVAPGRHLIQVEVLSTGRVISREVVLKPGETKELRFDLD